MKKEEEDVMLLIEKKVNDLMTKILREIKEEWSSLLKKENIEKRNWRLLNEIELFLKNNN